MPRREGTLSRSSIADPSTSLDLSTAGRVKLLAILLTATAVAAAVGGLFWPEPAGGGETYTYADIAPDRGLWWSLLSGLAVVAVINVPLQAVATMILVRGRGHVWATVGGCLMWVGVGLQATGVAGWASAYFYPTDPGLDVSVGRAVIDAANADEGHLFALIFPGTALVLVGTIVQCVGLFRARVVPRWVPISLLAVVLTFVVPGSGVLGLVTSIPMAVGAAALGYFSWRSVVRTPGESSRAGEQAELPHA